MRIAKLLLSIAMGAVVTGCAVPIKEVVLHDSRIDSQYMVHPDSTKSIYFAGLNDRRTEKGVGYEQDSKGDRITQIRAKNDVLKWVNREIVLQLKAKGFLFLPIDAPAEKRRFSLSGDLISVSGVLCDAYLSEVSFDAKIVSDDHVLQQRKYVGTKKNGHERYRIGGHIQQIAQERPAGCSSPTR